MGPWQQERYELTNEVRGAAIFRALGSMRGGAFVDMGEKEGGGGHTLWRRARVIMRSSAQVWTSCDLEQEGPAGETI